MIAWMIIQENMRRFKLKIEAIKMCKVRRSKKILIVSVIIVISIAIFIMFFGLIDRILYKRVYGEMNQLNKALVNGNISEVNKVILGDDESSSNGKGIVSEVVSHSEIGVIHVSKDKIYIYVKSPRISDFEELLKSEDEERIVEIVSGRINKYKKKVSLISLSYIPFPDEDIIDFRNYEFINSITAGLLEEYSKILKGATYIEPNE